MLWPIKNKSELHYCCLLCINVELLTKLSQFLLSTKLIDKRLFDCCGLLTPQQGHKGAAGTFTSCWNVLNQYSTMADYPNKRLSW